MNLKECEEIQQNEVQALEAIYGVSSLSLPLFVCERVSVCVHLGAGEQGKARRGCVTVKAKVN